jgi:hypothetical protein
MLNLPNQRANPSPGPTSASPRYCRLLELILWRLTRLPRQTRDCRLLFRPQIGPRFQKGHFVPTHLGVCGQLQPFHSLEMTGVAGGQREVVLKADSCQHGVGHSNSPPGGFEC